MVAGRLAWFLLLAVGCAASSTQRSATPEAEPSGQAELAGQAEQAGPSDKEQADARQIYELAEARFAEADLRAAVALMGRALDLLPADTHPELRHDLETRLTYMQVTAWDQQHDLEILLAARERLYMLLADHRERTASLKPAMAETLLSELFEQLYAVETRLEPLVQDSEELQEEQLAILTQVAEAALPPADTPSEQAEDEPREVDSDGNTRTVHVKTRAQRRLEDPEVQGRFRSTFADPGPVLAREPIEKIHGPRSLVRVVGARHEGSKLILGKARRYVRSNREALVSCYEDAFAREPIVGVQLQIKLETRGGEIVSAYVEDGSLVDRVGDRCLRRVLLGAKQFDDDDEPLSGTTQLRLMFFYDSPVYMITKTKESFSPGQTPTKRVPRDFDQSMPVGSAWGQRIPR